jgi:hypothetical protein
MNNHPPIDAHLYSRLDDMRGLTHKACTGRVNGGIYA